MLKRIIGPLRPNSPARKGLRLLPLLLLLLWIQFAPCPNAHAAGRRPSLAQSLPQQQNTGAQNLQETTTLEPGKPIERELAGEQKHGYQIMLAEGQYARVVVEQRGIDLVVELLGTDGKSIADFDTEIRNQGEEKIEVVAVTAGNYLLLVKARYPKLPAGRYEVRLAELRIATDKDRSLEEARKLIRESNSLCDTGLGEVRNGEGVYGLRRAFVLAGAESLVMSLWPVSDYTTRELMTNYYRNLKQGMGRGEALRQVQLDMLKRNPKLHAFYWANFIQSGEWANLDGKR